VVTSDDAERAIDFVRDNADKYGTMVTDERLAEYYWKNLRDVMFLGHKEGTVAKSEGDRKAMQVKLEAAKLKYYLHSTQERTAL